MNNPYIPQYSSLVTTIYNEPAPVGSIGRGSHYSVLRATTSYDSILKPTRVVNVHDFAVIWDEDHDTRLIKVIERMCIENLLSPVVFIGERKGGVTILVDKKFYDDKDKLQFYNVMIRGICSPLDDSWGSEIGFFDGSDADVTNEARMIINDTEAKVKNYLLNINGLWSLGIKSFKP
ncbi:hypothetical protein D3C79_684430 [compost metagenome]